jgi:hypothetical protein
LIASVRACTEVASKNKTISSGAKAHFEGIA